MAEVYYIPQWQQTFENAGSRKVKTMIWVPIPTGHDGSGYGRVWAHPRGCEVFAAWILIVQVAARCPVRGVLQRDCGPLTAEDLSIMTRAPAEIFKLAFNVLVDPQIGWLAVETVDSTSQRTTNALPLHPDEVVREDRPTDRQTGRQTDRHGSGVNTQEGHSGFVQSFLEALCLEFGWGAAQAERQKAPATDVAHRIWPLSPSAREHIAEWIIDMAREKAGADPKLRKPEAAWQAEVDNKLDGMGIPSNARLAALEAEQPRD